MIAASNVEDVREVLDYYNKEIDPLETFKIRQAKALVKIAAFLIVLLENKK